MSIINKIIELSDEKSINQQVICDALGIKSGTFSTWKARQTDPPAKYIACICEVLGVSIEYLLTGKEKNSTSELTDIEQRMLETFKRLTPEDQIYFIGRMEQRVEDYTPEQKEEVS